MKWIQLLYEYSILALCIIGGIVFLYIVYRLAVYFRIRYYLKNTNNPRILPNLIRCALPSSPVIFAPYLPLKPGNPETRYLRIETVMITKGGIHVLQTLRKNGVIRSPRNENWSRPLRDGRMEVFPSPLEAARIAAGSIKRILALEDISNVPVTYHVILTASRVRLSEAYEEVIPITDLVTLIRNQDSSRFLTGTEIRTCRRILQKHIRRT